MGIINTSPESFHHTSIRESYDAVARAAVLIEEQGADYVDVGGMSTAPYLDTWVSEEAEVRRVVTGVRAAVESSRLPVSVDTCRSVVAAAAMDAGATILNDVTGLHHDPGMASVIRKYDPSIILCAHSADTSTGDADNTAAILAGVVQNACESGADRDKMAVDPAVGFFRGDVEAGGLHTKITGDWVSRDTSVLRGLRRIGGGLPVLVSVSNKSFIGHILDRPPDGRISGSLAAEALAVVGGADIIRTHNVYESRDAVQMASIITGRTI